MKINPAFILVVFYLIIGVVFAAPVVDVTVEGASYAILVNEKVWFNSSALILRSRGKWFSSADGSLSVVSSDLSTGNDVWGFFSAVTLKWNSTKSSDIAFQTVFKSYRDFPGIVFEQHFTSGLQDAGLHQDDEILASFPSFAKATDSSKLYLTFNGVFALGQVGRVSKLDQNHFGVGNGGPIAFWDPSEPTTCIVSPVTNFMTNLHTLSPALNKDLAFGIIGQINDLPNNFFHSTMFMCGEGMNDTFSRWGQALQQYYSTKRSTPSPTDMTHPLNVLGYWTDNGAYYYYLTEPGMNYEDTLLDLDRRLTEEYKLPIRYWQLDSWWYPKGINDGVTLWESTADIFPHGMGYVHDHLLGNKTKSFVLHNRYFAPDNDYIKDFPFAIEEQYALPLTVDLFKYIMKKAKSWGMSIYEQDWLSTTYLSMKSTKNSTETSRQWMLNMDRAATSLDQTILLCMPLPRHLLQSLECPSMVYSRVSNDYNPGLQRNWQVNYPSLLMTSLNLIPFKDDFFSNTKNEVGCPFPSCVEPRAVFHSILSSLLAGFVAPSDGIDYVVPEVIMPTCRSDGALIKPDRPLTVLDSVFYDYDLINLPFLPEVGSAFSQYQVYTNSNKKMKNVLKDIKRVKGRRYKRDEDKMTLRWYYIVGLLDKRFPSIKVSLSGLDVPNLQADTTYVIRNVITKKISVFNSSSPAVIPNDDWSYQVAAPVFPNTNGFALLGETSKWIHMSKQRVVNIEYLQDTLVAFQVIGTPGEEVVFEYVSVHKLSDVKSFTVRISSAGIANAACIMTSPPACSQITEHSSSQHHMISLN
eukprot:TRINITY_DN3665_c0_g1_i2.p1 TRINITY_DN3665_c0_g1~~TRINITY_DN3665_c0_g1_i2.p1  ORF type:complete len:806 (+),score=207.33 TRINITY_DN3665_c0_g1_i2:122-2539(+)